MKLLALLMFLPLPALAQTEVPPGLMAARLLPGWTTPEGHRMTALQLQLEPGWKTYWRSPGDAGVPPRFDWSGSENLGEVTMHWPRPETIESGGERSLGYHRELILPIEIAPAQPGQPVEAQARVDFGLCDTICVPAHVALRAPPPAATPDPAIEAALQQVPRLATDQPACRVEEIEDGMRVTARFDADAPEAAMELDDSRIWVSQPQLSRQDGQLVAEADFIAESGKPFPLDPAGLRLTLIAPDHAVEYRGCRPAGS
ncbi:hypothetical protein GL279_09035 [Paracoccus limosus]|uniref:Thiol:disulfide interchange protein DsbD N-terminal domain-containing protein n=1 Tax=Paracoccus limosus TaxID=913252 RepID=A0A844H593_9RHOB|nr:protein-disulfide reductase DsbD domain-containing protein [Paracoccus limosus]MTH34744.1 hypothetical protein [Paracoccus limosus]